MAAGFPKMILDRNDTSEDLVLWKEVLAGLAITAISLGAILVVSLILGFTSVNIPDWFLQLDLWVYRSATYGAAPDITRLIFIFFNDPGIDYSLPIVACLAYVWWRRRDSMVAAVAAICLALIVGAWTISHTQTFGFRPRPFMLAPDVPIDPTWREIWAGIPTFPSGHMRELTGLSVVLAYFWPRARWVAATYVLIIAISRIYIGAHFPSDVAAGVIVGFMAGGFAILAVERGRRIVLSMARIPAVRRGYEFLVGRRISSTATRDPVAARALRSSLILMLLLVITFIMGSLVYAENPIILANYLRNTDNSLVYPVFRGFDFTLAQMLYWLLADWRTVIPALGVLILGISATEGRRSLGRGALLMLLSLVAVELVVALVSSHFGRPRPLGTGEMIVPEAWKGQWEAWVYFPDRYLLAVMALCSVLAHQRARIRFLAYTHPFLVCLGLFYFGAAWPTDALVTLVLGFLVTRSAVLLSEQVMPQSSNLGHDHP